MRKPIFFIVLSIILIIYFLINTYIINRGQAALKNNDPLRIAFLNVFIFLTIAYPLGRLLQNFVQNFIVDFLLFAGAFYMGMMVYFFFIVLLIDFLRVINSFAPIFPSFISNNPEKTAQVTFWCVFIFVTGTTIIGHINAMFPRIRNLEIHINKPASQLKELTIAAMSDIHLGTIVRNSTLENLVEKVNGLNPDLILLPGDIVDEDVSSVMEQNMAASLQKLKAPYGVYAITGNHEYFGGVQKSVDYIQEGNVKVLQDTAVKIADAFYLIGRKDLTGKSFNDPRKPLNEIMNTVDKNLPLILMDHQPFHLEESQENGIDLQLSGHTHHGQLFPFNLITNKVYEKSWGYLRKGETQYYVSCGVGTWGPPIRIGNRPEILKFKLLFQ
jgi:predicted MPP superfamily phosphohydrolase